MSQVKKVVLGEFSSFLKCFFLVKILKISSQIVSNNKNNWKSTILPTKPAKRPQQRWGNHFIQISAVAKVVAKEALAQPISAWPCIRDLNLPPNKRVPFFSSEKDYDASSSVIYNLYVRNHMASAKAKIRHLFGDTFSCRAAPPDIWVKLSGPYGLEVISIQNGGGKFIQDGGL